MESSTSTPSTRSKVILSGERATLSLNFGLVAICSVVSAALCASSGLVQVGIDSAQFLHVLLFLLNPIASIISNTLLYIFVMKRLPTLFFIPSLVCGIIHMVLYMSCGLWLLIYKANFLDMVIGADRHNLIGIASTTTILAAMFQATFLVSAALCFQELRSVITMVEGIAMTTLAAAESSKPLVESAHESTEAATSSGSTQSTHNL